MAKSGNTTINVTSDGYIKLRYSWRAGTPNIANNFTPVNWTLQLISSNSSANINSSAAKDYSVTTDGTTYLMDKNMNMYYVQLEYDKELTREDMYVILPEYKEAYKDQTVYTGINLGMGRVLLIKTKIYEDYMKELKSNVTYNDEYRDCYNTYCS